MIQSIQTAYDEAPGHYHPEREYNRKRSGKSVMHNGNREAGPQSLCVAIIEQAIVDYFRLVRAGLIKGGAIAGNKWEKYRVSSGRKFRRSTICDMTRQEAESLIGFLQGLDKYADTIELNRDWSDCYENILRLERTGNYRRYMMAFDNRLEVPDDCD
jgi:hypothetical protein